MKHKSARHELLYDRHMDVMRLQQEKWAACWDGGVQVHELEFDGGRFERLSNMARDAYYDDQLDRCKLAIQEMEAMTAGRPGPLTANLDFIDGLEKLTPRDIHCWRYNDGCIDEMWSAPDDYALIDRNAELIRHRVLREWCWEQEKERCSAGGTPDYTLDVDPTEPRSAAFVTAYDRLRRDQLQQIFSGGVT
jgi:hypothetical protein